jgi:hypothetical protein
MLLLLLPLPPNAAAVAPMGVIAVAACRLLRLLAGGGMLRGVNCGLGSGVPAAAAAALPLRCIPPLPTPATPEPCSLMLLDVPAAAAFAALPGRVPLLPCAVAGVLLLLKRRVA